MAFIKRNEFLAVIISGCKLENSTFSLKYDEIGKWCRRKRTIRFLIFHPAAECNADAITRGRCRSLFSYLHSSTHLAKHTFSFTSAVICFSGLIDLVLEIPKPGIPRWTHFTAASVFTNHFICKSSTLFIHFDGR